MAEIADLQLVVVVGPSGSGKSTLCQDLLATYPDLVLSVSFTTRAPRGTERDGVEYHFVDEAHFGQLRAAGRLLESATVHGYSYGTSRDVLDACVRSGGSGVVFDIDVQGARQLRSHFPDALTVMILPPSMQVLETRLRGRGTDPDEVIRRRMFRARDEIAAYPQFDHLVVNDDRARARDELCAIVLADRSRRTRRARFAESLLLERA